MPPKLQSKQSSKPRFARQSSEELTRIRARSPQALARWTQVSVPQDSSTGSSASARFTQVMANGSESQARWTSEKMTPKAHGDALPQDGEDLEAVKKKETKDRVQAKVFSVSRMSRIFKKLRQDHPYIECTSSQNPNDDTVDDSIQLICKLEERSREVEELLQEGEEMLHGKVPCIATPKSVVGYGDAMESPAKRLRDENDGDFISFSNCIDELSQQLNILSKECQLRHSQGFGTPTHSRTPERVELLAETKDILHAMQAKVTDLAEAHRKAETLALAESSSSSSDYELDVTPLAEQLDFNVEEAPEVAAVSSPVRNDKQFSFHLDNAGSQASTSPAWTDFDLEYLPEDGLHALECARSRLQSSGSLNESAVQWLRSQVVPKAASSSKRVQFAEGTASPSRPCSTTPKGSAEYESTVAQLCPQVVQIQHDMQNLENELSEAEVQRKRLSESLAEQRGKIQGIEDCLKKVQRYQQGISPSRKIQRLPIGKRRLFRLHGARIQS